ncbi:MAG: sulfatase-like hydrolase/transferase [Bryobacteraceae bacterium]
MSLRAQRAARRPNLVIMFADDLGYGDIACYGSPDVPTPHVDSIAAGGIRFTDGYVSCAVCSPSRAAMLTGRYQHRFGHEFNSGSPEREAQVNFGLPQSETIIPQYLKPAGYRSAAIGKWHLGVRPGYHPLERGFDEFFGFLEGGNSYITPKTPGGRAVETEDGNANIPEKRRALLLRGNHTVEDHRYLTDAFAEEAVGFIDRNKRQPFFLYLAFNAVHTPLHATELYLDRFRTIRNERHRMLAAMTSAMDDAVGAVLRRLRDNGLERDTLVVFLSDNGCPVTTGAGTNRPLNGEKCTYYEGGIRVPFVARWPGRLPEGKVYSEPVVSRDILPTFLSAAGIDAPQGVRFDGVDLIPYLNGTRQGAPHEALFWRAGQARAVRQGPWKLLEFGERYSKLYNLTSDIGEKTDVSARHPEVVKRLRDAWRAWSARMMEPRWPARYRELTVNGEKIVWEL